MSKFLRNGKVVATVLGVLLLVATVVSGVLTYQKLKNKEIDAPVNSVISGNTQEDRPGGSPAPDGEGELPPVAFNYPDYMKGMYITAGVDYLTDGRTSTDQVKADIDAAFAAVKEMSMNTVIFPLTYNGKSLEQKSGLPYVDLDFDVLEYASQKAREQGVYFYAIYEMFTQEENGSITEIETLSADAINGLVERGSAIAQGYDMEGLLLDSYYNDTQPGSYLDYKLYGGGMGYQNYMGQMSHTAVKLLSSEIHQNAPGKQVGMLTVPVWANASTDEEGSDTAANYTAKYSGNADNLSYMQKGYVDFVLVQASGATTSATIPYKKVVAWWGEQANACDIPLYILHYSSKACSEEAGWTEYDQLALQLIASENLTGCSGDVYDNLARFKQDLEGSSSAVLDYYDDTLNRQHILTELAVTSPAQKTYTTFEQSVTFMGASDPGAKITINDQEITTDQNGYFTLNMPLSEGLNKFVFTHKGKTDVYNITRQVQVIKDVSPTGNMSVDGGMHVTITATAYKDATVYAVVGGQTVPMMLDETGADDRLNESYRLFTGIYTAPASTDSIQDIGNIVVYGEAQGSKNNKTGAYIKVNKKIVVEDGSPIRVVADQAETFPSNSLNDLSDPSYFPLPQGALDYTVGGELIYKNGDKTYSYYKLASGVRVYRDDIAGVSESSAPGGNAVTDVEVESNYQFTDVIFTTGQQVSYSAKYTGSAFTVDFNYTNSVPSSQNLPDNPLFSSMSSSGSKVTLTLNTSGRFIGYRAFYNNSGQLVFRFNNPPGGVNGATIVVDPGHGGTDVGALGFLPAYPEKVITWEIAQKVADELESMGANVILLNTQVSSGKYVIQDRLAYAKQKNAVMYLSIHCNSAPNNSSAAGTEVYYFNDYSKTLAGYVSANVSSAMNTNNRGAKFGRYYVTRDPQMAGVLCEVGFLTNEREYNKLLSDSYQQSVAEGIASAANKYLRQLGGSSGGSGLSNNGGGSSSSNQGGEDDDEITDLWLDEEELYLEVGETATLEASVRPSGANVEIKWYSDDETVAKVNGSGKVTAKGEGECVITAETSDGEFYADCIVVVEGGTSEVLVKEITIYEDNPLRLDVGEEYELSIRLSPDNADNTDLEFESSNADIVEVDDYGNLYAVQEGEVTITVRNPASGKKDSIKVRVEE